MGVLPNFITDIQEQVNNISNNTTSTTVDKLGRCFLFDFENKKFVMKNGKLVEITDDTEKVKQWAKLVLMTEKDKYEIYKNTEFYTDTEDLKNRTLDSYTVSEFNREAERALTVHRYIDGIDNFSMSYKNEKLTISFDINLIDGSTIKEVTV